MVPVLDDVIGSGKWMRVGLSVGDRWTGVYGVGVEGACR